MVVLWKLIPVMKSILSGVPTGLPFHALRESEKLFNFAAPLPGGVRQIGGRRSSAFQFPEDFPKLFKF
jgi:hypothetical protein